jgi:DNA-binding IclR family transcriptional regulator
MTKLDLESVLSFLTFSDSPKTTQQIADETGMDKETVHKAVVALRKERLIEFLGKNSGWSVCR